MWQSLKQNCKQKTGSSASKYSQEGSTSPCQFKSWWEWNKKNRGRSFFQAVVNGNKNTSASVQSNKQADGQPANQDLSSSPMNFGVLSEANNWRWRRLSIDMGGELPRLVSREHWRETERGAMRTRWCLWCATSQSDRRKILRELARVNLDVLHQNSKLPNKWSLNCIKCITKIGVSSHIFKIFLKNTMM